MKIVVVKWGDAFIDTEDFDVKDAKKTKPVYRSTVGYLVAINQHGYVLATDKYEKKSDGMAAKMFVPHGMVVSVRELEECSNQS